MATHDYVLANQSGSSFRTDLNNALAAVVSNNSNATEPSTKYAYELWADTNSGYLKIRNAANNAWVQLFKLDASDIVKLSGSTNNNITTVTGANNIQGEANLNFTGSSLLINTTTEGQENGDDLTIGGDGARGLTIRSNNSGNCHIYMSDATSGTGEYAGYLAYIHGDDEWHIGTGSTQRWQFKNGGNLVINDGDLVINTAGHGIDFSSGTHQSGMSSETLDFYEEGSWTPAFTSNDNGGTFPISSYIRVGRLVSITLHATVGGGSDSSTFQVSGMPFAPDKNGTATVSTNCGIACVCRIYDSQTYLKVEKFDATGVTYGDLSDKYILINATYRCNP